MVKSTCVRFCSNYWHRAPNFFGVSWVLAVSLVLMRWVLVDSGWGLVTRKSKPCLETWNCQPCCLFFREGQEMELCWIMPTWLIVSSTSSPSLKSPWKPPKYRVQRASGLVTTWRCMASGVSERTWSLPHPMPLFHLDVLSVPFIISFYNKCANSK